MHVIGGDDYDDGQAIDIDNEGNIYVTGFFSSSEVDFNPDPEMSALYNSAGEADIFVAKFDNAANFLGVVQIGGAGFDAGVDITWDGADHVYVTGGFEGNNIDFNPASGSGETFYLSSSGGTDIFVLKLDTVDGLFADAIVMGGSGDDTGRGIIIDEGNIYLTGLFSGDGAIFGSGPDNYFSFDSAGMDDIFITKFDQTGYFNWAKQIGGTGMDRASALAVSNDKSVYITGFFEADNVDFDPDAGVSLLSSAGSADAFILKLQGTPVAAPPNLTLTATAHPTPTLAYHSNITYTIVLSNDGGQADGVDLTNTLPTGTSFGQVFEDLSGGVTLLPGPPETLTWSGTISANRAITLSYIASHTGLYNQTLTNTVEFSTTTQTDTIDLPVTVESPPLAINDVTAPESDGTMTFEVSIPAPSSLPVSVSYQTVNGTAQAGIEYTAKAGSVTIPAGQVKAAIDIDLADDDVAEANKTFVINLENPVNGIVEDGSGQGLILDDETSQISIGDVTMNEGNSGLVTATFPLTLSPASSETVSVAYQTAEGTATAGEDYLTASGSLTFTALTTSQTVTVAVKGDVVAEGDETFTVDLLSAVNANIADTQGQGTIRDDDSPGLTLIPTDLSLTEGVTTTYSLHLAAAPQSNVTLDLTPDNQVVVTPSQLTITPLAWSQPQTVTVAAINDAVDEGNHMGTITHTFYGDVFYAALVPITMAINLADSSEENDTIYLPLVIK